MTTLPRNKRNTQYELLCRLRFESLPMLFSDPASIGDLQALQAAKMVDCALPATARVRGELRYEGPAVVEQLTALARAQADRLSALVRHGRKFTDRVSTKELAVVERGDLRLIP